MEKEWDESDENRNNDVVALLLALADSTDNDQSPDVEPDACDERDCIINNNDDPGNADAPGTPPDHNTPDESEPGAGTEPTKDDADVDLGASTSAWEDFDTPRGGWTINSKLYYDKIAQLLKSCFNDRISKGHVHSFSERLRKANLRRSPGEVYFWRKPDPSIDAWMLVMGNVREVVKVDEFIVQHPECGELLKVTRRRASVRVMPDICPFAVAMRVAQKRKVTDDMEDEETRDGDTTQPQSQGYWDTVKK